MMLPFLCTVLTAMSLVSAGVIRKRAVDMVISSNFPDPSILQVDDTWYSFGTNTRGDMGDIHVQIARSKDFQSWTVLADVDALPNLPSWVNNTNPSVWAPDVIQNEDGQFVLYFSALSANGGRECVGVATSNDIEGPYTAQNDPWVCHLDQGGAIDPSSFRDSDGSRYVVYKIDGNSLNPDGYSCGNTSPPFRPTPIMQQKVAGNGIDKIGNPYPILDRSDEDGPLVEAPSIAKLRDGRYVLFFSSGCFFLNYNVNYALSDSVSGPYKKSGPLFVSGNGLTQPGGASIAADGTHLLFHAYTAPGTRGVYATTIRFEGDDAVVN